MGLWGCLDCGNRMAGRGNKHLWLGSGAVLHRRSLSLPVGILGSGNLRLDCNQAGVSLCRSQRLFIGTRRCECRCGCRIFRPGRAHGMFRCGRPRLSRSFFLFFGLGRGLCSVVGVSMDRRYKIFWQGGRTVPWHHITGAGGHMDTALCFGCVGGLTSADVEAIASGIVYAVSKRLEAAFATLGFALF